MLARYFGWCLLVSWEEAWMSGGEDCKFLLPHRLSPSCSPALQMFCKLILFVLLSPVFINIICWLWAFPYSKCSGSSWISCFSMIEMRQKSSQKIPSLGSYVASDLDSLSIKNRGPSFQSFFHLYLYTHIYTWKMPLWLNFMFFKRNGRNEMFDYLVLLTVHFFTWSCCVVITLGASCCNQEFSHNFWLRGGCLVLSHSSHCCEEEFQEGKSTSLLLNGILVLSSCGLTPELLLCRVPWHMSESFVAAKILLLMLLAWMESCRGAASKFK